MAPEKKDQSKEGTEQGSQTENNAPNQGTTGGQQTENTARSIGTSEQSGTGSEDAETRPTREQLSPQQPSRTRGRATSPLPPPSAPIDIPRRRETNVRDFESPMSRSEVVNFYREKEITMGNLIARERAQQAARRAAQQQGQASDMTPRTTSHAAAEQEEEKEEEEKEEKEDRENGGGGDQSPGGEDSPL